MAKLRHCVDISTLKNVYFSLVHSYVRYGLSTWGSAAPAVLSPLYTAIHKVLRIMTFAPYGNIDLHPIFDFLQVLNLDQMIVFEKCKFYYKVVHSLLPQNSLGNYFETDPFVNQHSYGLRSRTNKVPTRLVCHTRFSEKSFQIGGLKLWNKVPEHIKKSESLKIFKKSLKTFLMETSDEADEIFSH